MARTDISTSVMRISMTSCLLFFGAVVVVLAQGAALPGKGLAQHPFLYCGEWDTLRPGETMFIVRDGKVVEPHDHGQGRVRRLHDALERQHRVFAQDRRERNHA
jgi:hypothetical protein